MVKAIFFDIDGTLVSFKNHQISQSTFDALYKLKEKAEKNNINIDIKNGKFVRFKGRYEKRQLQINNNVCCSNLYSNSRHHGAWHSA